MVSQFLMLNISKTKHDLGLISIEDVQEIVCSDQCHHRMTWEWCQCSTDITSPMG